MGVNLGKLIPKVHIKLEDLRGKSVAIDAYNTLYQFLAIIRQPDGTHLKNRSGRVTSHLSGLLYRTANLVEIGIKPIYIFDGVPPQLKEAEIKRRIKVKIEARAKYEKALKRGKMEDVRTYAQGTSRLRDYMSEDSKRLLTLMGIPWMQAPSEGEAQAAHLAKKGDADFCASQDYDSLLFGAPTLLRNITISGRRKLPRKNVYLEVVPERVELAKVLSSLGITRAQLVDVGILLGTDYNPEGVKGVGPKTALKLIKEHGVLEDALPHIPKTVFPAGLDRIRRIFLHPEVKHNYSVEWCEPEVEGVIEFLCRLHDFNEGRVRRALDKMISTLHKERGKTTLEQWFKNNSS